MHNRYLRELVRFNENKNFSILMLFVRLVFYLHNTPSDTAMEGLIFQSVSHQKFLSSCEKEYYKAALMMHLHISSKKLADLKFLKKEFSMIVMFYIEK